MKWKKHTFKNVLIALSIIATYLISAPHVADCAEQQESKKIATIESIVSSGDGPATDLTIKLTHPATYTSYKTTSPLQLVIDFSQVTPGNFSTPLIIDKGNFKKVTASRFDTDAGVLTRVEIELKHDSEALIYALPTNPGELKISFPSLTEKELPAVKQEHADAAVEVPLSHKPALAPVMNAANEVPVRTLSAISVNNNRITLSLDGSIASFNTFRLNKPERYVVDLMNVKSSLPARLLPLNASGVGSARIGIYPDKVRVVLDSVNGIFPEATAVQTNAGVVITLDGKAADENAHTKLVSTSVEKPQLKPVITQEIKSEAKPEEITHVVPKNKNIVGDNKIKAQNGPSVVEMIDFQVIGNVSRISVKVNGNIDVTPPVKTPGYVTLIIKNSTLPRKLQRSLETRSFVSPVLRITPFLVKTKNGTNTKIRIVMRKDAPFEYHQEGDVIYVDFKHPQGLVADKLVIDAVKSKNESAPQKPLPASTEEIPSDLAPVLSSTGDQLGYKHIYKGRKVTLEFADADVRKIFQLLSEVSNKNFVLGDDVTGSISLKLVNVPWDQALDIILDTKNLEKREEGNIIIIKGKGKFKSQVDEELEIKKALAKGIELKTEIYTVNYSDVTTIAAQFNALKSDRGVISTDTRTSTVIVKDIPQALNEMRKLLKLLDVPEKQVMIEARIVEATSTFTRSLGVNWGLHYRDGSGSFMGINQLDTSFGGLANAAPTSGASGSPGGSMGISFGKLSSNISLDLRLNAAASAGMIKIISSPKVATLNNKAAKISQGQQIPYQNTTATTGAVTAFVAATLSLEVTPHINANGTIIMKIDAKNDAPGTGSPPPINTKQATTELLLKDGETTVIGGIFVDSDQDADDGVPYLMDIPFLGQLFKSSVKTKTKTELLIFITPRILGGV
ncbi:MAG: type IV pilus secretin PilQ [Desulfuromonadaceae bacterium]|nr:type IV pilus secretin PilQ [Desulfuromonadaceae bacterium]